MVAYAMTGDLTIVCRTNDDGSFTFIPASHPLYTDFLAWQALGNVAAPYAAPPVVAPPPSETDQLVAALVAKGVLQPGDVTVSATGSMTITSSP
jgi:hypothetical protein